MLDLCSAIGAVQPFDQIAFRFLPACRYLPVNFCCFRFICMVMTMVVVMAMIVMMVVVMTMLVVMTMVMLVAMVVVMVMAMVVMVVMVMAMVVMVVMVMAMVMLVVMITAAAVPGFFVKVFLCHDILRFSF